MECSKITKRGKRGKKVKSRCLEKSVDECLLGLCKEFVGLEFVV